MKVLFIGGTGNISGAVSRLAVKRGVELFHFNRGTTKNKIPGVTTITGDISAPETLARELAKHSWDSVVNWIAFTPGDIERDLALFQGKTRQYIFISSASVYQSPPSHPVITESTPLYNPFWEYARNKIACEERLNQAYRDTGFPMTIVRPSLTYDTVIPVALAGFKEYTIVDRILRGQKIIVHGDGTSLWTVTHSDDFAAGFLGLVGNPQAVGHAFHITSDEILTWNQLYTILAGAVGKTAHIVHIPSDFICRVDPSQTGNLLGDKAASVIFDNTKIKTFVPGFKAVIPFYQGIRRTLAWFDANPERKIANPKTNEMIDRIIKAYEGL
ncbi:MAG: SDR family oxidoreductase [Firmicutes bacterium]|nr:SDR family oxidoreductase [Bacillota bacterium]